MAQVERLYWMDGVMQNQTYLHWRTVAEKFEVQRRTVFNDMRFLRDRLGAPIAFSQRYKGWHYTRSNYQLPFLALSDSEADTLRRTLLAAVAYLPPTDAVAAGQLASRLSPYVRGLPTHGGTLSTSSEIFLSGQPALASHLVITDDLLADVRRAVDARHRLQISYYSMHRDQQTERVIQPYLLLNRGGELYLIGYCELRNSVRDFGLHRIQNRTVLESPNAFTVPKTFDVAAHLESAFELRRGEPIVTVRARFSPTQSRWVRERVYHPTQTVTEEGDGSIVVSLRVSGTAEAKRWIMSFGAEAEVLEPEQLRREINAEVVKILHVYA